MGYVYEGAVAPAILFRRPGLTRDEFIYFLDQVHVSPGEVGTDDAWDSYNKRYEIKRYHDGIEGLAHNLCLGMTKEFLRFVKPRKDRKGIPINAPLLALPGWKGKAGYRVDLHTKNHLGKPEAKNDLSYGRIGIGELWIDGALGQTGLITRIFEERHFPDADDGPDYQYRFEVRPVTKEIRTDKFDNEKELFEAYPLYNPELKYNWNQEKGHFGGDLASGFLWVKINGKYYLDPVLFDGISASSRCYSKFMGYTDLVLTAEAIKHGAWKLFSRHGLDHMDAFLRAFPDVKAEYDRAVWDSHTSLYAKTQGMTVTELLRFRMGVQD